MTASPTGASKSTKNGPTRSADEILLDPSNNANLVVCSIFEDQRPLKGAAGALDWRLRGFLSRFVRDGRISGRTHEFVYVPVKHHGAFKHLMLVGLGSQSKSDSDASGKVLTELAERVENLAFKKVTISRSSFPSFDEAKIKRALKNVDVEFME